MIPAERAHLHIAALTHPGMSGKNNEDRFAVSALRMDGDHPLPVVFAVVSDGIGGHRAGEVAADTAVEVISAEVAKSDGAQPVEILRQAIIQASQAILAQSQLDIGKHGMGATCACALIIDQRLFIASVGDSRIYLRRGDTIRQLTTDHTWIQDALDAGILTADQARGHPNSHVIRRYLGSNQPVEPDLRLRLSTDESDEQMMANQGMSLEPGDQILLCSDGLTDLVNSDEILAALQDYDQQDALQELTDLANHRGGHDNITIIALQVPISVMETSPTIPRPRPQKLTIWKTCLAGMALILFMALAATGGYIYLTLQTPTATITPALTMISATPPATEIDTALPTEGSLTSTLSPLTTPTGTRPSAVDTITPWPTATQTP
jgi:protein phosphatase